LAGLSRQLGSHMDSMKGNLSQVDGVLPGIAQTRGTLLQTLFKHLDAEHYEQVLLG
jgi:hypothetical protein